MAEKRKKRGFSEELKRQTVDLCNAGKPHSELCREYDPTPSALRNRTKRIDAAGSSRAAGNRSVEENGLLALRKESKRLKMGNDILKQAALIFARRS